MMRAVVILLVFLSLPGVVMAKPTVWQQRVVVVRDYTPEAWRSHVRDMVGSINAVMPRRAPRLEYRAMPEARCDAITAERDIALCVDEAIGVPGQYQQYKVRSRLALVVVRLQSPFPPPNPSILICHELMHAITGMPDDDSRPHPDASCVQGRLNQPGAFDVAYARWAYAKQRKHR